jgi:hypothetical protein
LQGWNILFAEDHDLPESARKPICAFLNGALLLIFIHNAVQAEFWACSEMSGLRVENPLGLKVDFRKRAV